MDIAGDDAGVWMTYDELAKARGIQRDGARRLAQRHRWRRHAGNDGFARVLVPPDWLAGGEQAPRDKPSDKAASAPDIAGVVTALQGAIDTLRQQLVRADGRADKLQAERDQARAAAQEAQEAAEALRRDVADRRARGLVARLKAAWRAE